MCACSHDRWADSGCDLLTFCLHSPLQLTCSCKHKATQPTSVLFSPGVDLISSGGRGLGSEVTAGHRGWDVWHWDWRKPRLFSWHGPSLLTVEDNCLSSCTLCPPHDFKESFCWIAVYCGYLACVGTAATEGSWETGWLHQPDPSGPHGQTQRVPGEDWLSAQKLSESSVVWYRYTCTWYCVTVCYSLCSKSSGSELLTVQHEIIIFCLLYDEIEMNLVESEECYEYELT